MEKKDYIKDLKNVKIIFGNGFDLYCGLSTKYSDYFNYRKTDYDLIIEWIDSIKGIDIITCNRYITGLITNWRDVISIEKLNNNISFWDIYFVLKMKDTNYNWCDVEEEMLKLVEVSKVRKKYGNNVELLYIKEYVEKENLYLPKYYKNDIALALYIKAKLEHEENKDFFNFIYGELLKFENSFGKYIHQELLRKENKFIEYLIYFLRNVSNDKNNIVSIDTFNYTVVDNLKLLNDYDVLNHVNHINGNYREPIFGVDSSQIQPESEMYVFTKTARRLNNNTLSKELSHSIIAGGFNNLIIFGHSLNNQDYSYFFPIFNYMKINDISYNSVIVFIYYIYDANHKEEIKQNYILRISRLIAAYDHYINNTSDSRLLDILSATGRVIIHEIDKPCIL